MAKGGFTSTTFLVLKMTRFVKNLTKNAAANKKPTTTNYDLELPVLINFGNVLATGFCGFPRESSFLQQNVERHSFYSSYFIKRCARRREANGVNIVSNTLAPAPRRLPFVLHTHSSFAPLKLNNGSHLCDYHDAV